MKWLWFAGPLVGLFVFFCTSLWLTDEERRITRILRRWIDEFLGPLRVDGTTKSRRVRRLPAALQDAVAAAGGGTRVTDVVLVPRVAYLAVRAANLLASSNQFSVVCKLQKSAPTFECRPLPIVDGQPAPNTGVEFVGDEDFHDSFIVTGKNPKAIRQWLASDLRESLLELKDVWFRTEGKTMTLTLYGTVNTDRLDELLGTADAIFSERGADPDASLFGEEPSKDPEDGNKNAFASSKVFPKKDAGHKDAGQKDAAAKPAKPAAWRPRLSAAAIDLGLYAVSFFVLAATLGSFQSFHPAIFFHSPDFGAAAPWQGGWTTKGFGVFVAAECLLVSLFVAQTFLATTRNQSIGKRLLGLLIVRTNGDPVGLLRGCVMRSWALGLVPLVAAGVVTPKPFTAANYFASLPSVATIVACAAITLVASASIALGPGRRGIHDFVAGTRVIETTRWRPAAIQLGAGTRGIDPLIYKRLLSAAIAILLFVIVNVALVQTKLGLWVLELPFDRVHAAVEHLSATFGAR